MDESTKQAVEEFTDVPQMLSDSEGVNMEIEFLKSKIQKDLRKIRRWVKANTSEELYKEEPCCKWNIKNEKSYCPVHYFTEVIYPSLNSLPTLKGRVSLEVD